MVVLQQAMAIDHDNVQAVVRVGDDGGILIGEQLVEHLPATARHLGHAHAFGKALGGVQLTESSNPHCRIGQAGTGEAPGADGSADQRAFTRRAKQPVTKQCQIQALNADALGPARRSRQDADVRRAQAILANACQGSGAGLDSQGRGFDMDRAHRCLLSQRRL